jgi:IMP dehydrogenase/GMP reductase
MHIKQALSFEDVLLVPQYSEIKSRDLVSTNINITTDHLQFNFNHPIIPANMKTIIDFDMAKAIYLAHGLGLLHRFNSIEEQIEIVNKLKALNVKSNVRCSGDPMNYIGCSIGVKEEDKINFIKLKDAGVKIFCIDIAHGDSSLCINMIKYVKSKYHECLLIAGNVATGEGAKRLWNAGADVVKVGIGSGCLSADTRVLMSNGIYKNIIDINIGDRIINKNGIPVAVTNVFSTGIKKVKKIKTNSFYKETFITDNHEIWVGDLNSISKSTLNGSGYAKILDLPIKSSGKNNQSKYCWKPVQDLQQDIALMPRKINFELKDTFNIILKKKNNNQIDYELAPTYELGYIFGSYLGDGNAQSSGTTSWSFNINEQTIINNLLKCLHAVFHKNNTGIVKPKGDHYKNVNYINLYYSAFAQFLRNWGIKDKKHLPQEFLVNHKEYLQGIFDGLIDSDGSIEQFGRISLSNNSPQIIELFSTINYLLYGYIPNILCKKKHIGPLTKNHENCKTQYIARSSSKALKRLTNNYQAIKIINITDSEIEIPVYDLTVDCDTHSFIANNIIVHNSICSTRINTGNGVLQLTAIMDVAEAKKEYTNKYFISDGGIVNVGAIAKALCFADMVMVGSMFSGCSETPGAVLEHNGTKYKSYSGSSTLKATYREGAEALVKLKGSFNDELQKMLQGLRSSMSYQGVSNLTDFKENPQFVQVTAAGLKESHIHTVDIITK